MPSGTSVVVATRDRRDALLTSLEHLTRLPERPPVVVVDNGSTDGTAGAVRERFPGVRLVALPGNLGAAARNLGVALATTPYVAFADDDSWWEPGALARAASVLDACPTVAVVAARVLVGPEGREDPTTAAMAASPLPAVGALPGRRVMGFLACGAVVRRSAFLAAGGFDELLFFFGEEQLLALDLADAGFDVVHVRDVVAHHHPTPPSDPAGRRTRQLRNALLTSWLRRPPGVAARGTARLAAAAVTDTAARRALAEGLRRGSGALGRRRVVRPATERALRAVEADDSEGIPFVSPSTAPGSGALPASGGALETTGA